jgi:hypothetical protein
LTWVSEGKDFRRLCVTLKAGEVFDIAMLAHDRLHQCARPIAAPHGYHTARWLQGGAHARRSFLGPGPAAGARLPPLARRNRRRRGITVAAYKHPGICYSYAAPIPSTGAREVVMAKGQMRSNKEKKKPKMDKNLKKGGAAPSPFASGKPAAGQNPGKKA